MCASFLQRKAAGPLAQSLKADFFETEDNPRKSLIFPKYQASILVRGESKPILTNCHWGLLMRFMKPGGKSKYATHNAKTETFEKSPLYGPAWRAGQRCVIPVSEFYEWKGVAGSKTRLAIQEKGADETMIAGIWDVTDHGQMNFTMMTTDPNEFMKSIHDRMPVVLTDWEKYLSEKTSLAEARSMLVPFEREMAAVEAVK